MTALRAKGGAPFRWGRAVMWAVSWGVGSALGIGVGAWLTVVGEAGAPGIESIDPGTELLALPVAAFAVVFSVHVLAQVIAAAIRGARAS